MKLLITSDSHGRVSHMQRAVERECPDRLYHLGDVLRDLEQLGADAVLFGHTHQAMAQRRESGLWLINPGSIGGVRAPATYAVLTVQRGELQVELKEL